MWYVLVGPTGEGRALCQTAGLSLDGSFNASPGWIANTLKRHGIIGINLHGEANDLDDAEREKVMLEWTTKKFHPLLEKHNISPECCYNADQTGLFYTKLPNRLYVYESEKKDYAGVKQMKSKDRITMMICTSAAGAKLPVAFVGKAKKPVCFRSCGGDLPAPYTNQKKAWFDRGVTVWWINRVFWPQHVKKNGLTKALLLLDNCLVHDVDESKLEVPDGMLIILFLPENVTSRHQPADMGMIATLKVGYRKVMLSRLLSIFDAEGGFETAARLRKRRPKGDRGLAFGGKATVLDAMEIIAELWNTDGKYAKVDSIKRCWRKAKILPGAWEQDINNAVGSASLPDRIRS